MNNRVAIVVVHLGVVHTLVHAGREDVLEREVFRAQAWFDGAREVGVPLVGVGAFELGRQFGLDRADVFRWYLHARRTVSGPCPRCGATMMRAMGHEGERGGEGDGHRG